jgi:hypothetical protein
MENKVIIIYKNINELYYIFIKYYIDYLKLIFLILKKKK